MIRRRFVFSGRVQGVGFRARARGIAREHPGVSGWVRNEADGTVTLEIQGEAGVVDAFVGEVRGRLGGCIMGERTEDIGVVGDEVGFVIAR